ncbi:hypothetical protein NZ698_02485 [Chryseobacterium sp. PBS4-4]|jgi:hypothetical protein|uniref:DUF1795 domain-containing protein n=1 Tax=Chryseobacterium edaphi TaxID=2976532 RepID=A0ABT2W1D8_9FLAO|nr:hypothetical protein [Chryseobacterium edaphi]MCU7616053.1 hypothetical protein [Chryseobacterium edaphi]
MKKIIFIVSVFISVLSFSQKLGTELYDSENYSIEMPDTWKATNDAGIVNIFPTNQIGAITISEYDDLNLPKAEIKKFILALYKSSDEEKKIKTGSGKKGYTEYNYEFFDEHEKIFWITKVLQKEKKLYLLTINCQQKYWNGNYMKLFNEAFETFKIKK